MAVFISVSQLSDQELIVFFMLICIVLNKSFNFLALCANYLGADLMNLSPLTAQIKHQIHFITKSYYYI